MLKRKCEGDVPIALDILSRSAGIEVADRLSIEHIRQSVLNLQEIRDTRVQSDLVSSSKGGGPVIDFNEKHA
jgi:hypothetical protein